MGVNTLTYLPATAGLDHIQHAIQKLTDADDVILRPGLDDGAGQYVYARGGHETSVGFYDLEINRADEFGDGQTRHHGSVHLHSYVGGNVYTLVYGGNASAFWCALGEGLVRFFGGVVDYNDCDASYRDLEARATRYSRVLDGDEQWTRLQKALEDLPVVTDEAGLERFDSTPGIWNRFDEYNEEER